MDLTPLMVIFTQDMLLSDLRSGCSSQLRRFDTARRTPPPLLVTRSSGKKIVAETVSKNLR